MLNPKHTPLEYLICQSTGFTSPQHQAGDRPLAHLYGKAGAAWMNADYRFEVNSGIDGATVANTTRTGWNVGGGLEYMLGSRWSAKLEYD